MDIDDNIVYSNSIARSLFRIPENDERNFDEIIGVSGILGSASLIEQVKHGRKESTEGNYLLNRGIFSENIRVYSKLFREQRVIRIAFQEWEPSFRHEKLINKISNMDVGDLGLKETCSQLIALFFELVNIDVAIVSLRGEEDQSSGSKHLEPVAARGVVLEKGFQWEMSADIRNAFKNGQCFRTDGKVWPSFGVSDFLVIPIMGYADDAIGAIHLGVVDSIKRFKKKQDQPLNAIDFLDEEFFTRLQSASSQLVERASRNPIEHIPAISSIFSEIKEGLLLLDKTGKVVYATPEAYRIAESSWETMNEKRTYRVCDKDGVPLPRAEWPLFRALSEGIEITDEPLVLDFGTHQTAVRTSVRIKPEFVIVTMKDVTGKIERAQKQDYFYSSIAHELRTPITPLKGLLQIVSKGMDKSSSDFDLVVRAQKQVDRLAKLINDMLEATRVDSGLFQVKKELVDIGNLVNYLKENWKLQFPKSRITVNAQGSVVCVLDPYRFEQVICNLIENSVKYCEVDPEITITLSGSPFVMEIADNGIGMSDEVISQVFNRFYQANVGGNKEGVGIGLYVTKRIIDLHDGTISFVSEVGKGTTVRVQMGSEKI